MRRFVLGVVLVGLFMFLPASARAGKPVTRTYTCCSLDNILITVDGSVLALFRGALDLEQLDGQRFQITGKLYPGDRFRADPKSLKKEGGCPADVRATVAKPLAWELARRARFVADDKKRGKSRWKLAFSLVNRAIALASRECVPVLTRAELLLRRGRHDEALADVERGDACPDAAALRRRIQQARKR